MTLDEVTKDRLLAFLQPAMVNTIVSRYGATSVATSQFFIAWNSVATLAYAGFSRTLLALKRAIEDDLLGLKPENEGAKWPKTTLGCLREGVELTEDQVHTLRDVCRTQNANLQKIGESDRSMDVKSLCCVTFHCRTLERRLTSEIIPLEGRRSTDDGPPSEHLEFVRRIMAECSKERHDEYYPRLAPNGRTIDRYYRIPHIESTLVYDLQPSAALTDGIYAFRQLVDKELPNCYAWFDATSWHMTVRGLVA